MAAESWVTIGGLLATTASAVAAFFAVKQTMLQRINSTKPQIIINKEEIKTIHSTHSTFTLFVEETDIYYVTPVSIKNIGLGTALNIKYNWSFDYQKHIKTCGFQELKEDPVFHPKKIQSQEWDKCYYFEMDNNAHYKYFKFIRNKKITHYSIKEEHCELEYIMPVTQEKSPSTIEFPTLILLLLAEIAYSSSTTDDTIFDVMNAGQLQIQYEDISGNKTKVNFNCSVQLIKFQSITAKGPRSTFKIEFSRIHSESKLGLRWVRKSYADFINQHDYNKNK